MVYNDEQVFNYIRKIERIIIMNKEWMINDIKNALDDSYNNDTIIDLYNLLVEFDNNAVTNSLKEFLKTYNK